MLEILQQPQHQQQLLNMSKILTIKLTRATATAGPFNIYDQFEKVIALNVPKRALIDGISYTIDSDVDTIILESTGICEFRKSFSLSEFNTFEFAAEKFVQAKTACLWRHLTNIQLYNSFYGNTEPYIIEYPFSYQYQDEILQNVKDYTKAYEYLPLPDGVFSYNTKIETNNEWFNKAIVYNSQQNSGILNLVPKPLNNLQAYNQYPKYESDGKTILYTKSDNFYQYNTFWNVQKNSQLPAFNTSCESLSIDKILNQDNMDYTTRSFKKDTIRAKDLKIRHILDSRSDIHLVSQFIIAPSQISYK